MSLKKFNEEKLSENAHMREESERMKFNNSSLRNQQFRIGIDAGSFVWCMAMHRRVDSF